MLHQIGVGALGPVFRTYEPDRDRLVAVKAFRIDLTPEQARSLADELSRVAEAGLFHPSIVEPISAGLEGTVAYRAEEYVAAESLDVAMRHYAPAAIDTVLPFITQLAGAIDFARAAGVGHGALHPRDIFMTPDEARVTGFGVVEALEHVGFRAPVRRPYSPPERIAGEAWSTPADIFSLAAITYELLTARRPSGLGAEIGPLTPGAVDSAAGALHAVLVRAMDENPSHRYPTALAFASALEAAAHERAPAEAVATPVPIITSAGPDRAASRREDPLDAAEAVTVPGGISANEERALRGFGTESPAEREDVDDIVLERDEDEAHHQLTLRELNDVALGESEAEHVHSVEMDEDSEIEAEADRYAADDFLLDAAGAASVSDGRSTEEYRGMREEPVEEFRATGPEAADVHAVDRDKGQEGEPPPVFQREERQREHREAPAPVYASAPTFGRYQTDADEPRAQSSSRWLLTLLLVVGGVLAGFLGGYALWGRSTSPTPATSREFSEQAVAQPKAPSPQTPPPASKPAAAQSPSSAPATGATPPRSETPPPMVSETPAAGTRSSAQADGRSAPAARTSAARTPPGRPPGGSIVIRSTPSGAGVTVNGRWRGRTPLAVENLPYARYDVRIVQPGFVAVRQAVTLSTDDPDRSISVRLEREARTSAGGRQSGAARPAPGASSGFTGSVFVDSRPRGAKVFIDGKEVGTTPLSLPDVRIGMHVVRLELPDHRTWTSTTTVTSGQQSRVTGSLDRIQ